MSTKRAEQASVGYITVVLFAVLGDHFSTDLVRFVLAMKTSPLIETKILEGELDLLEKLIVGMRIPAAQTEMWSRDGVAT